MNKRIFIKRRPGFQIEQDEMKHEVLQTLGIRIPSLQYVIIYDIFQATEDIFEQLVDQVFIEKNRDELLPELPKTRYVISIESLPGQFDQRSNSAEQCARLIDAKTDIIVHSSIAYLFDDELTNEDINRLEKFWINPVELRKKDLSKLDLPEIEIPNDVEIISDFINFDVMTLREFYNKFSFAMNFEDLLFIQTYFATENRDPFETELRVLDTYWSDHCRHTTFETELASVTFEKPNPIKDRIEQSFLEYLSTRTLLKRDNKPITLMDLATINAKYERSQGRLNDLEISEEINAASIYIDVDVDGVSEPWLLMFKNETHNHPTEIEPFGGASTCLGGAIRDPLSGRSYVYSAMRVTGAADITESFEKTLVGKLPQRIISKKAAQGYSSYGNQIGLATTFVEEFHHPGYLAKRLEIGAVIGATPVRNVRRETPQPNDVVLLVGGRTGRDGIGGATGSSKAHTAQSIQLSGAEVQKGNAPEERKIQRLFRHPDVAQMIKKSNDFGAGGVSVAIGELAAGLVIDLDKVPTKYQGINGTELAISESQERMAVVIDPNDVDRFTKYCHEENIEVTLVAIVTASNRLVMKWRGRVICDLDRDFIDTSGVRQQVNVKITGSDLSNLLISDIDYETDIYSSCLSHPNVSSKQGLEEMFDSSIGRTTVLSPYGGKYQKTKVQSACQIIPTRKPNTTTASIMAYGFNPYISEISPYHGSIYAIIDSMAKIVATGGDYQNIRFSFQEYFQRLHKDPVLWGSAMASLLGAFEVQKEFGLAAIGGKDSMSGTYQDLHVPPTLVSFAVVTEHIDRIISPEFKQVGSYIYLYQTELDADLVPDFSVIKSNFNDIHHRISEHSIISAYALGYGGLVEAITKCSFGNQIGVEINTTIPLNHYHYGSILVESTAPINHLNAIFLGQSQELPIININNHTISIQDALDLNERRYKELYPIVHEEVRTMTPKIGSDTPKKYTAGPVDIVRVFIPVFPGTNCEYDSEDAFVQEGAKTTILVFNNMNETAIQASIDEFVEQLDHSHILMLSGGFSSGDEPDGSGKFIATVLRNPKIAQAIERFLAKKHLILGICNGFQALIKSGLLPYGEVLPLNTDSPTLFKNKINRHVAKFVQTKVSSQNSPWLSSFQLNETHRIPMSHGEGQFIIHDDQYQTLLQNNQIAFQYVDDQHNPTYHPAYNPNGSSYAIEGILSKDGLILGKMGHSERYQKGLFKNIHGNKHQNIFANAIQYFKGDNEYGRTV